MNALVQPITDDDDSLNDVRRAIQFGVPWGLATVAMESMANPFDVLGKEPVAFFVTLVLCWCPKCALVACLGGVVSWRVGELRRECLLPQGILLG